MLVPGRTCHLLVFIRFAIIRNIMAIPDFQACMLPFLQHISDGKEHHISTVAEALIQHFGLTDAEKSELLPSGQQTRIANRIQWASTHLAKAGIIERPSRGVLRITPAGQGLLKENLSRVDMGVLERFPAYREFKALKGTRKRGSDESEAATDHGESLLATPEDLVERGYGQHRKVLASDLLERVRNCSPQFFERLVVDLLVKMGYGGSRQDAGEAVGQSGDGGIDGIIKEDKLGLDAVYIQAKRWEGTVGRPVVQQFCGSLVGKRARKGVLITTSRFTAEAEEYVDRIEQKIVLLDGEELAGLMIDHGIGVADVSSFTLKRMDADYFEE
jgi:restriction system protein